MEREGVGEHGEGRGVAQGWELLESMSWSLGHLCGPSKAFIDTCRGELAAGRTWRLSKGNCLLQAVFSAGEH